MNYETQNERLKDFIKNIKMYFNQEKNQLLYNKRNIIKIVEFEGKQYVVKYFKIPHMLNQVIYRFFRDSKAKRSFDNSIQLRKRAIHTPEPVGYIEFPTPFRFQESFYISELFNFDFEIRAVLSNINFPDRETILKQFVEYTYKLHQKGVYHLDYSPGNILIKKLNTSYIFSIVDVNRMKFTKFDIALRMRSMSKLTTKDEDNKFMAKHYAKISKLDEAELLRELDTVLKKQVNYLSNKKRLKKIRKKF